MNYTKLSALIVLFTVISCQKEAAVDKRHDTDDDPTEYSYSDLRYKNESNRGKGKKGGDSGGDHGSDSISYSTTFRLSSQIATDALYQFSFSSSGDLVLFQSDSTVTSWGTDFWGSWSEPFNYSNNKVNYIKGLTNVTYEFEMLSRNTIEVKKTLIVQPYPSGQPTTTVSYPGTYKKVN